MNLIILFIMFFLHIYDDYRAQGILASMKQKKWWKQNAPQPLYEKDYLMALFEHAFSWAFTITIPWVVIAIKDNNITMYCALIGTYIMNTTFHMIIDDLKANQHLINLIQDQCFHFLQILITWIIFCIIS